MNTTPFELIKNNNRFIIDSNAYDLVELAGFSRAACTDWTDLRGFLYFLEVQT